MPDPAPVAAPNSAARTRRIRLVAGALTAVLAVDVVAAGLAAHGSVPRFLLFAFPAVFGPWAAVVVLAATYQGLARRLRTRSAQLADSEARFSHLAAGSPLAVLRTDHHGLLGDATPRLALLLDRPAPVLTGQRWLDCFAPADTAALRAALESPTPGVSGEIRLLPRPDADPWAPAVWLRWRCWKAPRSRHTGTDADLVRHPRIVTLEDVTAQHDLAADAGTDAVTGLPDRAAMIQLLQHLRPGLAHGRPYGIVVLTLGGLSELRRDRGHEIADGLLRSAVEAASRCLRDDDMLIRLRGDEFAVVVRSLTEGRTGVADNHLDEDSRRAVAWATLEGLAARMSAAVTPPEPAGVTALTATTGAFLVTDSSLDPEQILSDADPGLRRGAIPAARTAADPANGRAVGPASPAPRVPARTGIVTEREFALALDQGQLRLVYQPVLDLRTGKVVAAEALVRWQHPEHGLLLPGQFLPLAERSGLVVEMGAWVLREALGALRSWPMPSRVAVNMSAQQLAHLHQNGGLANYLVEAGIPAERLCVEVLETHLLDTDSLRAVGVMSGLGVHVAMDDLGSGYSSLLSLKDVPVDLMKVDRAFVADLGRRDSADAILRALVSLGHDLAASVVAEGVETRAQAELLVAAGCDLAQGFLWSPGVSACDVAAMMTNSPWEAPVPGLPPARRHRWAPAQPRHSSRVQHPLA
jgi:EAL domain-containing protein (putative c-di-GMP-specific phosphodiesterase class I)/GGDEF domain-containing protein/PAS domain-containing protein